MPPETVITPDQRTLHTRWLLELTQLPTASGKEHRVIRWIERWTADRADLRLHRDPAGNLIITRASDTDLARPALYFTAHLDHPAFVIEERIAADEYALSFRGGVMDEYFNRARVALYAADNSRHAATIAGVIETPKDALYKRYRAKLDAPTAALKPGDVGTWDFPPAEIADGLVHTTACDDLAAAAAALAAFDILRSAPAPSSGAAVPAASTPSSPRATGGSPARATTSTTSTPAAGGPLARLLFTRAEEIGFIGAIAAVKHQSIARNSRVIALENSRSFPDSPIGEGPIVRVGDRISIFSPSLTDAVAKRAEDLGGPQPTARQKTADAPRWKWQRKLMPGGACEASVFCNAGYEATCVCLPLGNYHNMADLANVQSGTNTTPPTAAREHISLADFEGLVDLLVACGTRLGAGGSLAERFDKLYADRKSVLSE